MNGFMLTLKMDEPHHDGDQRSVAIVLPSFIVDKSQVLAKAFDAAHETADANVINIPADCDIQRGSELEPLIRWLYTGSLSKRGADIDEQDDMGLTKDEMDVQLLVDLMTAFDISHRLHVEGLLDHCTHVAQKLQEKESRGCLVRTMDIANQWLPMLTGRMHDVTYDFLVSASAREWVNDTITQDMGGQRYWVDTFEAFSTFGKDVQACAKLEFGVHR